MRKYLIVAAAAGGLALLGAPAQAADLPVPAAGDLLGGVIDPDGKVDPIGGLPGGGDLGVQSPLDGSPVLDVKPGDNSISPKLRPMPGSATTAQNEAADEQPAGRAPAGLPIVGDLLSGLAGGGINGGGLTGGATGRSSATESGLIPSGLPLLGGLLPEDPTRTVPTDPAVAATDVSGLPQGGTDVPPPSATPADKEPPSATPADKDKPVKPAASPSAPSTAGPGDDAKRLQEEPIDDEGTRTFSDGRPVAGEDPDYR